MDAYLQKVGFHQSELDDTLYVQIKGNNLIILVMYVDDLLIKSNNDDHISQGKEELQMGFEMMNLGLLHYYLRVEVMQIEQSIFISQTNYVSKEVWNGGLQTSYHPHGEKLKNF